MAAWEGKHENPISELLELIKAPTTTPEIYAGVCLWKPFLEARIDESLDAPGKNEDLAHDRALLWEVLIWIHQVPLINKIPPPPATVYRRHMPEWQTDVPRALASKLQLKDQ
jgi:hypothetical protein